MGNSRSRSPGITVLASIASRERIRFRFPRTVLISPLWATNRNGCANGHDGNVFVEKRLCTTAIALVTRRSRRSRKKRASCTVVSIPLNVIVCSTATESTRRFRPARPLRASARRACADRRRGGPVRVRPADCRPPLGRRRTGTSCAACRTVRSCRCRRRSGPRPRRASRGSRCLCSAIPANTAPAAIRDCGSVGRSRCPPRRCGRRRGAIAAARKGHVRGRTRRVAERGCRPRRRCWPPHPRRRDGRDSREPTTRRTRSRGNPAVNVGDHGDATRVRFTITDIEAAGIGLPRKQHRNTSTPAHRSSASFAAAIARRALLQWPLAGVTDYGCRLHRSGSTACCRPVKVAEVPHPAGPVYPGRPPEAMP